MDKHKSILFFHGDHCPSCKVVGEKLKKYADHLICINVEQKNTEVKKYEIQSIPTILLKEDKKITYVPENKLERIDEWLQS